MGEQHEWLWESRGWILHRWDLGSYELEGDSAVDAFAQGLIGSISYAMRSGRRSRSFTLLADSVVVVSPLEPLHYSLLKEQTLRNWIEPVDSNGPSQSVDHVVRAVVNSMCLIDSP